MPDSADIEQDISPVPLGPLPKTDSHTFTLEEIRSFAGSYDPQAIHLNEEAAAKGPFGQLIASGWHGLSISMGLFVRAKPFGDQTMVGAGVEDIRFHSPLLPGMRVHVEAEVASATLHSDRQQSRVRLNLQTLDSDTGTLIISQKWNIRVHHPLEES